MPGSLISFHLRAHYNLGRTPRVLPLPLRRPIGHPRENLNPNTKTFWLLPLLLSPAIKSDWAPERALAFVPALPSWRGNATAVLHPQRSGEIAWCWDSGASRGGGGYFYVIRACGVYKHMKRGRGAGRHEILSAFQILLRLRFTKWVARSAEGRAGGGKRESTRTGREIGRRRARELQSRCSSGPAPGYNQKSYSVSVAFGFLFIKPEPPSPTSVTDALP